MIRPILTASVVAGLIAILKKTGNVSELISFCLTKDNTLIGTVVINILIVIIFAEMYLALDNSGEEGEHFGFKDPLDAYYFSTVTSSSVGYGDLLPSSRKAKMLTIVHILTMFFIVLPIILRALEPGN
jgi:hypothetical protein